MINTADTFVNVVSGRPESSRVSKASLPFTFIGNSLPAPQKLPHSPSNHTSPPAHSQQTTPVRAPAPDEQTGCQPEDANDADAAAVTAGQSASGGLPHH